MEIQKRKYGHIQNKLPKLNKKSATLLLKNIELPEHVNLVIDDPIFLIGGDQQPYQQGNLGSCTTNALAFCFVYNCVQQKYKPFMPSRLDMYLNERLHMLQLNHITDIKQDGGANISDCEYTLEKIGVIPESVWEYNDDVHNQTFYQPPETIKTVTRVHGNDNNMYWVNNTEHELKQVLANKHVIICGISVFQSFESDKAKYTGIIPYPNYNPSDPYYNKNEPIDEFIGGHAVAIVGYTNDGYFIVRNSWGVNWGLGFYDEINKKANFDEFAGNMRGYFKIPVTYLINQNLASDFYVVQNVGNTDDTVISVHDNISLKPSYAKSTHLPEITLLPNKDMIVPTDKIIL